MKAHCFPFSIIGQTGLKTSVKSNQPKGIRLLMWAVLESVVIDGLVNSLVTISIHTITVSWKTRNSSSPQALLGPSPMKGQKGSPAKFHGALMARRNGITYEQATWRYLGQSFPVLCQPPNSFSEVQQIRARYDRSFWPCGENPFHTAIGQLNISRTHKFTREDNDFSIFLIQLLVPSTIKMLVLLRCCTQFLHTPDRVDAHKGRVE